MTIIGSFCSPEQTSPGRLLADLRHAEQTSPGRLLADLRHAEQAGARSGPSSRHSARPVPQLDVTSPRPAATMVGAPQSDEVSP